MPLQIALLAAFFALGLAFQVGLPGADRFRDRAWTLYFWTITPVLVFFSFTTVGFDRGLALAIVAAMLTTWTVIAIGFAYARLVSAERDERGAIALAAGVGNTGFLGYPLAQLAFGQPGLALMVLYDRLASVVPVTALTVTVARMYGRRETPRERRTVRAIALNPPLLAFLAAVSLRLAGVELDDAVQPLGRGAAAVVGPAGFLLLGVALPLDPLSHGAVELRRAAGVLAVRFAVSPLVLFLYGRALGADVPPVFYLAAAMPCAFHLLILARVFDLRPQLMRLLVVGSTVPAVVAVVAASAILG